MSVLSKAIEAARHRLSPEVLAELREIEERAELSGSTRHRRGLDRLSIRRSRQTSDPPVIDIGRRKVH